MIRPRADIMLCSVLLALLVCEGAAGEGSRLGSARISLTATPTTLPADGNSPARILIEVRDRSDQVLPDGTPIFCYVDNGQLEADGSERRQSLTVDSEGGYATVYCTSVTPGPAVVTVRVQDSRETVTLQFLAKGQEARKLGRVITLSGGWVGYCLDLQVVRARDAARARIGGMLIDAVDGLEVRIADQTLRAWGCRVKRDKEVLEGEDLYYELATGRGVLRRFGELGVERTYFNAYGVLDAGGWEIPEDAFRAGDDEGVTWLVCESCLYFLGEKVVVKNATMYAQTQKVFRFPPYWVVGLPGYAGASNTQVIGVSTDGGLAVDFPLFYRVNDTWAGSVKIQRGASGTSFIARDGWSIGIAEEYQTANSRGSIEASGLFGSDWGLQWRDQRKVFGDDQSYLTVAWPDHRSLFADASVYHYADSYRLNVRAQYDRPENRGEGYRVVGDWLTESRPLTPNSSFRLGTSVGGRRNTDDDEDWVFENELYGAVDIETWRIGDKTRIKPSLSDTYVWDTDDYEQNTARVQLRLSHQFTSDTRLGMNYQYSYRSGDTTRPGGGSLLGVDYSTAHERLWSLFMNGTWDLDESDTYAYLGIDYYFRPRWRFGAIGTHYDYDGTSFDDVELELGRSFGDREVGVRYSFENDRFSLELGNLGL